MPVCLPALCSPLPPPGSLPPSFNILTVLELGPILSAVPFPSPWGSRNAGDE